MWKTWCTSCLRYRTVSCGVTENTIAVRDHTRRRIPSGLANLGYVESRAEKPHHHRRFDEQNGPKGGFTVYEKESPQKHQRDVHRTELIPQRKISQNHQFQRPLHGFIQKPERRISDLKNSSTNASYKFDIHVTSLRRRYFRKTARVLAHKHETTDSGQIQIEKSHLPWRETNGLFGRMKQEHEQHLRQL